MAARSSRQRGSADMSTAELFGEERVEVSLLSQEQPEAQQSRKRKAPAAPSGAHAPTRAARASRARGSGGMAMLAAAAGESAMDDMPFEQQMEAARLESIRLGRLQREREAQEEDDSDS